MRCMGNIFSLFHVPHCVTPTNPFSDAEILQLLKDNGADLTKVNMKGFTPADIMIAKHDVVFDGPRG